MKKLYVLSAGLFIGTLSFAQCIINPLLFGPNGNTNYSIIPDTVTNIPVAYVGAGYTTDLQFHIQPDTTTVAPNPPGTFDITQVQIDSVHGLPAGFTYMPNPTNGTFYTTTATPPGSGYGCVALTGMATPGQETGGPANNGVYPLTVYYTGTVVIFSVPVPQPSTIVGYKLIILPANGINTPVATPFAVAQGAPNPADLRSEFNIISPSSGMVQFTMYNVLGSLVKSENISATKGTNRYSIETSSLTAGVYMCSFRLGDAVVTRRITVSH